MAYSAKTGPGLPTICDTLVSAHLDLGVHFGGMLCHHTSN